MSDEADVWDGRLASPLGLLARAAFLRCPRCGRRKVIEHWFKTPPPCPRCGLNFDEDGDAAVGWLIVNLGATMAAFFVTGFGGLLLFWPTVPWTGLTVACVVVSGSVPFLLVPFTRTVWAAVWLLLHRMDGPAHQAG